MLSWRGGRAEGVKLKENDGEGEKEEEDEEEEAEEEGKMLKVSFSEDHHFSSF